MAKHMIYTFYAELNDFDSPKTWRRFEINGEKTIAEFAYATMIMFEMQASHLFYVKQYRKEILTKRIIEGFSEEHIENARRENRKLEFGKDIHYEFPIGELYLQDDEDFFEPDSKKINHVAGEVGTMFKLEYDYGDGWEVLIQLEGIREEDISLKLIPRILEGEGFGIVEDVGGTYGLTHLAEVLKDTKHEEYENFTNWLDSTSLDLDVFDIDDMNYRLKKIERIYRNSYEHNIEPTENDLKLLLRDYLGRGYRGY